MSSEIKLLIKQTNGAKESKEITLLTDNSIQDLKDLIHAEFNIPSGKQNLIYKGKVLFNEKKIEDCNLSNGDTILLVEKRTDTDREEQKPLKIPLQSGVGTPGALNLDLLKQPMSGNVNLDQLEEIMKRPEVAGQLEDLLDNPDVINAMMENPAMKPMLDANPMMKSMMSNPQFLKNMLSPETLKMMKEMQQGGFNPMMNPFMQGQGQTQNTNNPQTTQPQQPMMNPFMFNPYMMGMNAQQQQQGQTTQPQQPMMNPFMFNPYMMGMNAQQQQQGQTTQPQQPMMNPYMYNPYMNMMPGYPNTQPQTLSQDQLKEKYKNQLSQLNDMGFCNEADNLNALTKTSGNIDAAVERLISNLK